MPSLFDRAVKEKKALLTSFLKEVLMKTLSPSKVTVWSSLGAGLEYYDFIVFAYLAPYLSAVFFPEGMGLLKTYMAYAVGYFARPLGAFLYGMMGDTKGRKKAFIQIISLITFSTACMGFLPSFKGVGAMAPLLLFLLRILQGVAYGAELPTALTVVSEYHKKKNRAQSCSFVISGATLGSLIAAFSITLLSKCLTKAEIIGWGWRLPFLLGGALGLFNFFVRRRLLETPAFLKSVKPHAQFFRPGRYIFAHHKVSLLLGVGLIVFMASLVTFNLYLPVFASKVHGFEKPCIYQAMTMGLIWCALITPLFGVLGDKVGEKRLMGGAIVLSLIFGMPVMHGLLDLGFWGLVLFCVLLQTLLSCVGVMSLPLLVSLFPVDVRLTGVGLCYNITFALVSCIPLFFIVEPASIVTILGGAGGLSGLALLATKKL